MRLPRRVLLTAFLASAFIASANATKVPEDIKKTVTFLFVKTPDNQFKPIGTGFFVSVPKDSDPSRMFLYLATARHVLQDGAGKFFPTVWIRVNKSEGDAEYLPGSLRPDGVNKSVWEHPTDEAVDIAVLPIKHGEGWDIKTLPAKMFAERGDVKKLGEGTRVFFSGLFLPHFGRHKNYPIIRFGWVSLITDEPIYWDGKLLDLHLIDTFSFGGSSGSPVFLYPETDHEPGMISMGQPNIKLAGVMKGNFNEPRQLDFVKQDNQTVIPFSKANMGVAAIVPAHLLHDILFSEGLTQKREPGSASRANEKE